jgi:hypothetical protein
MPLDFEKATALRQTTPITRRQDRIDGKCSTPTVSARSEFTGITDHRLTIAQFREFLAREKAVPHSIEDTLEG